MGFHAEQRKVSDFLTSKVLEIPRNQRRYVWRKNNWQDLLDDINFTINTNDIDREHFIGSIV